MALSRWRGVLVDSQLVVTLNRLFHDHHDVRITSGHRSRVRNRLVGGARNSLHLRGRAVDFTGPRSTQNHLRASARKYGADEILDEGDHSHIGWR